VTPADLVVVLAVLALYAWSAHLEHRRDQIEAAKRRHPTRRRDEEE
jgi:hypothetical protein